MWRSEFGAAFERRIFRENKGGYLYCERGFEFRGHNTVFLLTDFWMGKWYYVPGFLKG